MRTPTLMERELRRALMRPDTRLRTTQLSKEVLAWVDYNGRHVEVTLDPMRGGLIECVVHELIHAVYAKPLKAWGRFEEPIVVALEGEMMGFINTDERKVRWWREAIARKLDKEDE